MEKRLYTDTRTLYINDKPVSDYRIGNLRYGEPEIQKTSIKDFSELRSIIDYYGYDYLSVKFYRGFKKIKIGKTTFLREDVNSLYLLKQGEELEEDCLNFLDLSKKLTVPEFIEFCKDRGLSVNCQ